ncbi:hypothetical protein Clacol_001083 [Clathrus columnatus]|uniref:Jacalin-type lectin domain-containing protein n=1 Tax=Clathrus columnatus TaxID=1419009 RepID=A0AAV4ZXM7_9AGAM|nr:hypothetical protein Clacol_001083 [Clathrus columnatus]
MSTPAPIFIPSTIQGGSGGQEFSDLKNDPNIRQCRLIQVNYWTLVGALGGIQLVWENPRGESIPGEVHGSTTGPANSFYLTVGERIIALTGHASAMVNALTLITNKGRSVDFGLTSTPAFQWTIDLTRYPNAAFHHFTGRSGNFINALQAVFITVNREIKRLSPA